jgi:hypothetical protein
MGRLDIKFCMVMRSVFSVCMVGAAISLYAQEAKTTLVMPPPPLLPINSQLVESDRIPVDSAAVQAVLKEAGLVHQASRVVMAPAQHGSSESGWVIAYQFEDATGAHSAFTYFGGGGKKFQGEHADNNAVPLPDGTRLLLSGTSVVRAHIQQYPESVNGLLRTIENALPKVGGPKGAPPLLPTLVPAKGLEAGSLRYALGPISYVDMGGILPSEILGWDKAAEVVTARYQDGGVLTLLLYPTPQIAGDRGRAIEASINANRSAFGTVKLRREGPMLVLATGGFSPAKAQELVEGIHLPLQLTWEKKMPPEFHTEVQKTYSLLTSIAIFCGLGALAAVILGLFLGGGRAAIRVLQGKPAATEPEFLRIDLRGKSAPLRMNGKPEDQKG